MAQMAEMARPGRPALEQHMAGLRRYAQALTRDGALVDDLVQETLTRAVAAADSWRAGSDPRPWLFRIMHNIRLSELRRARTLAEAAPDLPAPVVAGRQYDTIELRQVLAALDRLPEAQRQPIILVALRQMSYADAARHLGLPLGTFMSRLGRGRAALRAWARKGAPAIAAATGQGAEAGV